MTKESIDLVINYMERQGYPKIKYIYCCLMRKYLYGKLKVDGDSPKIFKLELKF